MGKPRTKSFYAAWTAAIIVIFTATIAILSSGPDFDVHLTREVPSDLDAKTLGQAIALTRDWPKWFYSLESAQILDRSGRADPATEQKINPGSVIELTFDPQRGPWRKFNVTVQVTQYVPNQMIQMKVMKDSNHKLTRLLDDLEWKVEILPAVTGAGSLVRGTATARTAMWRSRLFGKLFEKILMNQVYYPDIIHLAGLGKVEPTNPFSETPN
jgi:hypothetical protein